jgi:hypothetical protein
MFARLGKALSARFRECNPSRVGRGPGSCDPCARRFTYIRNDTNSDDADTTTLRAHVAFGQPFVDQDRAYIAHAYRQSPAQPAVIALSRSLRAAWAGAKDSAEIKLTASDELPEPPLRLVGQGAWLPLRMGSPSMPSIRTESSHPIGASCNAA